MASAYDKVSKRPLKAILIGGFLLGFVFFGGVVGAFHYMSPDYVVSVLSSENFQKRQWAVDQLILKGTRSGKPSLAVALDEKADPESRRLAIFVLGEIHYKEATPHLMGFFKGADEVLGAQSAYALGRMGDPALAHELVANYPQAPKGVQLKVIAALGELGGDPEGRELLLKEAKQNGDTTVQQAARYSLQKIQAGVTASAQ
ncbi:MAG: HEAT repeat domain-containing protein [Nitrospinae bacterium]|nr:HEAT repeat domain-containing protein [Nitrospinota bacterium]